MKVLPAHACKRVRRVRTDNILYYTNNMTHNFASSQTFAKAKLQSLSLRHEGAE